jgi:hypothetical protein
MRKTELRLLRRSRLDIDRKAIRLRPEDTKTGRARVVPLTERVVEALRSLPMPPESEYVFVNPEAGQPWNDPHRLFKKACKALGLAGVWLHDTRRSFSTNARRRGSSESEVMKVTGHTTRSTFDRYNIVDEEDAREVIRRLEAGAATELARTPRSYGKIPSKFWMTLRVTTKAPRLSYHESGFWRALEDLNVGNQSRNLESLRGIAGDAKNPPPTPASESGSGLTEAAQSASKPQPSIESVRARVTAAIRALGAGRLDIAFDELRQLERDLGSA